MTRELEQMLNLRGISLDGRETEIVQMVGYYLQYKIDKLVEENAELKSKLKDKEMLSYL